MQTAKRFTRCCLRPRRMSAFTNLPTYRSVFLSYTASTKAGDGEQGLTHNAYDANVHGRDELRTSFLVSRNELR
jgi:hypothetical protein